MADMLVNPPAPEAALTGAAAWLETLTTRWSLMGGFIFIALIVMSIVSIVGRKLMSAPVNGDMELLMMGSAVATAMFLPVCEMGDHHIRIDAFTMHVSQRKRALLDFIAHALLTLCAAVITWRTALYAIDAYGYLETSTLLQIPLWIPVSLIVPSFFLLTLAAVYRSCVSLRLAVRGEA